MGLLGRFSPRGQAMNLYKRGMTKAHERDMAGAVEDYTAVVKMAKAPPDVKAMALFNRALAYSGLREYAKASNDLKLVLSIRETPSHVLAAARDKQERMSKLIARQAEHQTGEPESAV